MATEVQDTIVTIDGRDMRFTITVVTRDIHTHGALGRADKAKVRAALARAAFEIADALRHPAAAETP